MYLCKIHTESRWIEKVGVTAPRRYEGKGRALSPPPPFALSHLRIVHHTSNASTTSRFSWSLFRRRSGGMIFDAGEPRPMPSSPLLIPLGMPYPPPLTPHLIYPAEELSPGYATPGNARINNLSYPTFWMWWWRASVPSHPLAFLPLVLPTRSLADLRLSDASISSSLQLDTSPEGLYYAYSLERMLCKSGLENRFLIAARKKSGDFTPAHLHPKRVAHARLGELGETAWIANFFHYNPCVIRYYTILTFQRTFLSKFDIKKFYSNLTILLAEWNELRIHLNKLYYPHSSRRNKYNEKSIAVCGSFYLNIIIFLLFYFKIQLHNIFPQFLLFKTKKEKLRKSNKI